MQNLFRAEMLRVQKTLDADEENIFRIENVFHLNTINQNILQNTLKIENKSVSLYKGAKVTKEKTSNRYDVL